MAFKRKFSSRLFTSKRENKKKQTEHLPVQEGQEKSLRPEEGKLVLPPEHPLVQLWDLCAKQGNPFPAPELSFKAAMGPLEEPEEQEEPGGLSGVQAPLLSADEAEQELSRLEKLVASVAEIRLENQKAEEDEAVPDLDARVQVFLPVSRVSAWVLVYPPSGNGAGLDRAMLEQALKSAHVSLGVDWELLDRLPDLPERYFHLYLAARGEPPLNGRDGYVIDLFSRSPMRALMEDESGQVDYAAEGVFQKVEKGDVICHIIPPTGCRDGKTVTDEVCYARAGRMAVVPKGRNTAVSEEGDSLVATCKGHVEFSGRSFQVKPVMSIGGNVDFSTGDINYLGDVHIRGDVCSGFTVRATGSITVDGVVEACTIEAGSNLVVRKGVQGNNRAILHAHRNIYAKYLESCNVYARENLEVECIVNCNVYSDGDVVARSGRGTVIGGKICAAREVSANIVGARSECRTSIILGSRTCEAFERECLTCEIADLEKDLENLSRRPDSAGKPREMAKLKVQISANKLKLQQFDQGMEGVDEEKEAGRGRLVCGMIYPGVEITIGKAFLKVEQESAMCTTFLKEGEISLHP